MGIQSKGTTWSDEDYENQEENVSAENKTDKEKNKVRLENIWVFYTNADSLMNKRQELQIRLNHLKTKPHVIAITEVKNKKSENINPAEFNIKGYSMYTNDLQTCSRGVAIYVINTLKSKQIYFESPFQEAVTVEIKGCEDTLNISNIYRSPNSSVENNTCLKDLIRNICDNSLGKILMVGDFNLNDIDWELGIANSVFSNSFIEVLRDNFLIQNVVSPTRARGLDEPHLLDLVITNESYIEHIEHMSPLGKSDHSVLFIKCSCKIEPLPYRPKLNYEKGNYLAFKKYLSINWEETFKSYNGDINSMWNFF